MDMVVFVAFSTSRQRGAWLILNITYDVECNVMNNSTEKNWYDIFCQDVIMIMMLWIK